MFNEKQKNDMRKKILLLNLLKKINPHKKNIYEEEQNSLIKLLSKQVIINKKSDCFKQIDIQHYNYLNGYLWWPTINSFVFEEKELILYKEKPFNASDKELIELTHDFYKSTNNETYKLFEKVYKKNKGLINFEPIKDNQNIHGLNAYSSLFNTNYTTIFRNGYYMDLNALIHEFGHTINNSINYNLNLNKSYEEIVPTFFELISHEYFENIGIMEASTDRINDIEKKKHNIQKIQEIIKIYKYLENNNYSLLKSEYILYNLDTNKLNELFIDFDLIYYIYITGYIVASNLFNIYIKDKEYALNLLYRIISYNKLDNIEFFEKLKELNLTNINGLYKYENYIKRRIL